MREIKFRAWDTIHNNMSNSFTLIDCINDIQVFMLPENFKFMQYTGLLDKNRCEIYEGDILRFKHWELLGKPSRTAEVTFVQDHMNWILRSSDNSFTSFHKHDDRQYEVIGNIYENPELLKPKGSEE